MAGLRLWLRPPRNLLVLFGVVTLLPAATLAVLGVRLLGQDRALAEQRRSEMLEHAADRAVRVLEQEIVSLTRRLKEGFAPADVPDGAVYAVLRAGRIDAVPAGRAPYYPDAPGAKEPPAAPISLEESRRPPDSALRKASAREAAEIAADLLRPPEARAAAAAATRPAGILRRLLAFLLDGSAAAGVGFLSAETGRHLGAPDFRASALLGAGAFLVVNEVVFASLAGARSLGMVLCRVAVVGSAGRPAHVGLLLARLFAWLVLFIGAPLALFDAQRRTLHDLICGTAVHQPAGGG